MVSRQTLSAVDRWGLQNDLFALVKAGVVPLSTYLELAETFSGERSYLPLSSLDSHLFDTYPIVQGTLRARVARTAHALTEAALSSIGYEPAAEESQTTAMLRDQLLTHGALTGHSATLDFLTRQFAAFLDGGAIHADIFRSVMTAGAVTGDRKAFEAIKRRFEASSVEHERMALAAALGRFGQWSHLEAALDYALTKVPDRIRFLPLVAAAENPAAGEDLWNWFEGRLERLSGMHPLLFERVVAAFVPGPGLHALDRTRACCDRLQRQNPRLKDVIALSLERLAVNDALRQREKAA
jgi:tricorn protease interacting factor F2/3